MRDTASACGGREVGPELLRRVWVLKDGDSCRELEYTPTTEFAELIDKHRVVLCTPLERCVHHASVVADVPFRWTMLAMAPSTTDILLQSCLELTLWAVRAAAARQGGRRLAEAGPL